MNDQKDLWNKKHASHAHASIADKPRELAVDVAKGLHRGTKLLELGCGVGSDAFYFAEQGADVVATDFSEVIITQNAEKNMQNNLRFQVVDIAQALPFADDAFGVVYAHLSLHYYDKSTTAKVFAEIGRVLKAGGMLYFSCKSVHDPLYGDGEEIQPGVFSREGHIRHFFSVEYDRELLSAEYDIVKLDDVEGVYDGFRSAFVQAWARRKEK
jgi:SAM-dependent methyltransferase